MRISTLPRRCLAFSLAIGAVLLGGIAGAVPCGPFTDLTGGDPFCPFVLEIFTLGITTGVTPTTYDPAGNVTRLQMAAFLSRTVDRTIQRSSRRAAVAKYWTPKVSSVLGLTTLGFQPHYARFDGADIWVSEVFDDLVQRVRASDGKVLDTWTGAIDANAIELAMGRILVAGISAGRIYSIDPSQPAGAVTTVASGLSEPTGIAFDGFNLWAAGTGRVLILTPGAIPWSFSTVTAGFVNPTGVIYDGSNIWVGDGAPGTLHKLGPFGAVLQTVTLAPYPYPAAFDGTNIWVTNYTSGTVSVVRASNGAVLATLTGFVNPTAAAFDGERVMITDETANVVSLWKAADLTSIGFASTGGGTSPYGVCSDGANFWIVLRNAHQLARF